MRCGLACAAAFGKEVATAPNASVAAPIRRSRRLRRGSWMSPQVESENRRDGMMASFPLLVRFQPGFLDHAGPHLDIGLQPRVELFRRAGRGLAAEFDH